MDKKKLKKVIDSIITEFDSKKVIVFEELGRVFKRYKTSDKDQDELINSLKNDGVIFLETNIPNFRKKVEKDVSSEDSLKKYLNDIKRFRKLSQEEVIELTDKIAQGDTDARAQLINSNLRLVVSIAKKYKYFYIAPMDLIQAGNNGLIKAVENYDYTKGKLSTYATPWIKKEIILEIYNNNRTIRIPAGVQEEIKKINKAIDELSKVTGIEPTIRELSEYCDISEKRIEELIEYDKGVSSIDVPVGEDEDTPMSDLIEDIKAVSPEDMVISNELKKVIREVLKTLSEDEQKIIKSIYGFDREKPMTIEEIQNEFGFKRDKIRGIIAKVNRKLREPANANKLKDYIDE